jgi:division/cell wall cluster transcriptional repressor MraZ
MGIDGSHFVRASKVIQSQPVDSAAQPVNLATLYSGVATHGVEGNRTMLVASWRCPGAPSTFFVVLVPSEEYLLVCPPAVFEEFLDELRSVTTDKAKIQRWERELNNRVRQVNLDKNGRLPLPPEFLAKTRINEQAVLVGRFSKFEIWSCEKHEASLTQPGQSSPELSEKLQEL